MKKKFTIVLSVFLLCFVTTRAQKIKYENSFEEAKRLSLVQNKPLAILITINLSNNVPNSNPGLSNQEVINTFNQNFINYKIDRADTASKKIIRQYNIVSFPSLIYVDSKGGLLFKDFGGVPFQRLLSMADQAIYANKEKSLVDFDAEYKSGVYSAVFLKDYINKRKKAGITKNGTLIEKYIDLLNIKELDNYNQVLFILQAGPIVDSRAFKLAHSNGKIIDSIFKTELSYIRNTINDVITANTMDQAIAARSISQAYAAANFTRTSWGSDYRQGGKSSASKMLEYYMATRDTANYLIQAGYFYDEYYMNISADSIRRMDQKNKEKAQSDAKERAITSIPKAGGVQSFSYSYSYATNNFATELNNGAFSVYETGTKNVSYLIKAMLWSKRSIELKPVSAYYDTLAHLLYRLEFYSEAEITQLKAIELAKAEKRDVKQMQDEYMKIKKKTL